MQQTIYLKDYQPPAWQVEHVSLCFLLEPASTEVTSRVHYRRQAGGLNTDLELHGQHQELLSINIDDVALSADAYELYEGGLRLLAPPDSFTLSITTCINPEANTALEGLYRSSGNYCTQCEAEGFRRITYYLDRPDVMATFDVYIEADQASCPVLLSNGNPTGSGELDGGRHWASWRDPFPKPSYLFALVAGQLAVVEDQFTTGTGRVVDLRIYTEPHHIDQCDHAMASIKRAMRWDEQRFGLEYDLDLFMVVAVDDFNMGAMENKGLNIFNSKLVFASPETATDDDYIAIEAVIGHEYFHNWTGNRVTCRDWFQLSLKEGLTVFRDQQFTADLHSPAVKRIEDVRMLRTHQFAEDAGPMAHPIRPASFIEINNFYTVTVYEKGAEVVRLYHTLLGEDGFRRGMALYFERHDGQAVTTEDFLAAMADANGADLSQMQRWYDQAGTPKLFVRMHYDAEAGSCSLHCRQSCPATPEAAEKAPFPIPLTLGLLAADGREMPLQLAGESEAQGYSRTLLIDQAERTFTFVNLPEKPLPSLLRGFSAPVELDYPYTLTDDAFLMRFDVDPFNRWAASQRLAMQTLLAMLEGDEPRQEVITAYGELLADAQLDDALRAEALMLPSESDIAEACKIADPGVIHAARNRLRRLIATEHQDVFESAYHRLAGATGLGDQVMQQRKLRNVLLSLMAATGSAEVIRLAWQQFESATNMTDQYAALAVLSDLDCPERQQALAAFEQQWQGENNVMDKWFGVQAASTLSGALSRVQLLMKHDRFSLRNPNRVRSVIGGFALRNPAAFHAEDGSGYAFLADQVIALDKLNPQIAARLVRALINWRRIECGRSALMRAELRRIAGVEKLSPDVGEIVARSLSQDV